MDAVSRRELMKLGVRTQASMARIEHLQKPETPITARMYVEAKPGEWDNWYVEQVTVTPGDEAFGRLRAGLNNHVRFVPSGTYTRLTHNGTTVMSDSPDEKCDHGEPVAVALQLARTGLVHCLVNGLGLGMVANALLSIPNVRRVIVVEKERAVYELIGRRLELKYQGRLVVKLADAFTWKPDRSYYDVIWNDVWDTINSDNLEEMDLLEAKYVGRCTWQGSWARKLCERRLRERHWYDRSPSRLP